MEAKYYTPEIEEFHVGFEYEYFIMGEWQPVGYHPSDMAAADKFFQQLHSNEFRVKCLDREDIESLGWEYVDSVFGEYSFRDKHYMSYRDNSIQIGHEKGFQTWIDDCFGVPVKNKSELKRLLKQLNIE